MENTALKKLTEKAIRAAMIGGNEIMGVYNAEDREVEQKADDSPLTIADKRAHDAIGEALKGRDIPVLSEEGKDIPYEEREQWSTFWLVDPLDGTKEFIKRNGEFTVNIALIEEGRPVAGVIHVPDQDLLYFGYGQKAYKVFNASSLREKPIDAWEEEGVALPLSNGRGSFTVVASRSHLNEETEAYIESLKETQGELAFTSIGSSLKICLVAEGKADIYPRFAPTMEWDTAAGHAIVRGAGKDVIERDTGETLCYNKKELQNPCFIVE